MTQDKIKMIHRWYSWILAAIMTILGVLFILSCLDIYTSGPRPYSSAAIGFRFLKILIPVIIGCIGVIGGFVLNLLLPTKTTRVKSINHPKEIMLRMRKKADMPPVKKEIRLRLLYRLVAALLFICLMVYPLGYFLTPEHFSISNLNSDIIRAVIVVMIPTAIGLALCWLCRVLVYKSYQRETSLYKKSLATRKQKPSSNDAKQKHSHHFALLAIRIFVVIMALAFLILGIFNGGAEDVLKKAIAICTECIGLG
jgi:hypothetical protein